MREVSMLVWREGSGARVERGDRHAPHVAHMVLFSGYVRLHAPDVSRRAPRVVALVRARHLCEDSYSRGATAASAGRAIELGVCRSTGVRADALSLSGYAAFTINSKACGAQVEQCLRVQGINAG